jgi:galactose mutarotase-like enzyme
LLPPAPALAKESHALTFSEDEPAPIRRLKGGLMRAKPETSPIEARRLVLSEQLFEDDAVILEQLASSFVSYGADQGPSIEMYWNGFPQLGGWSKPGAAFLCIEPWCGFASPEAFYGEFEDKPGLMHLAPGARRTMRYRIRVGYSASQWE